MNTQSETTFRLSAFGGERGNVLIPDSSSQQKRYLGISAAVNGSRGFKAHVLSLEKADQGNKNSVLKDSQDGHCL